MAVDATAEQRPAWRELAIAAGWLGLATLCLFHLLTWQPTAILVGSQGHGVNDLTTYYIPSRAHMRQSLLEDGEWPRWNPYLCLGLPYTGNPQSALYYPPNWLTLAFDPAWSLSWILVGHLWFGGLGVFWLLRQYRLSFAASLFGGLCFLGAPFLVAQAAEGHYGQVAAVSWTPWAFLAYERFRAGLRGGTLAVAACFAMSFFAGHAQETYYLVLLLSLWMLCDAVQLMRLKQTAEAARLVGRWTVTGLTTLGLVAVDLLPILISSRMSLRVSFERMQGEFGWSAYNLAHLQQLLDPFAIDRPETWVYGTAPFWEKVGYFGVIPLVLALAAVWQQRSRPRVIVCFSLALLTLLFALGTNGFVFPILQKLLPGMTWFRLPSRILFFTSFFVAILAAEGFESLTRLAREHSRRRTASLAAVVLMLLIGWLFAAGVWGSGWPVARLSSPWLWCGLLLPVIIIGMIPQRTIRWGSALLPLLLVAELTWFSHQVTGVTHVTPLSQRDPELWALLQTTATDQQRPRVFAFQQIFSDSDAMSGRIDKVRGYDPAGPAAYLLLVDQLQRSKTIRIDPMDFSAVPAAAMSPQLLDLLGVRYFVEPLVERAPPLPEGWREIRRHTTTQPQRSPGKPPAELSYRLLKNPNPLPRAFVVGEVTLTDSATVIEQFRNFSPRDSVLLTRDVLPAGPRAQFESAKIAEWSSSRFAIDAHLNAPGYLVIHDLWYPGWTASVNGQKLPVVNANWAFRAVALPAGQHRVVLKYQPPGWSQGLLISALTVVGAMVLSRSKSRPAKTASPTPPSDLTHDIDTNGGISDEAILTAHLATSESTPRHALVPHS